MYSWEVCVWCVYACACVFTYVWAHICAYKCMQRPRGRCWESSSIAFWRWDYRWAAMSTWHFCALWGSKLWFSTLCSSHFNHCALSPALLGHLFSLIVNSPFLLLLPRVVSVTRNGKKNLIYFLFFKELLIAFPWICKVVHDDFFQSTLAASVGWARKTSNSKSRGIAVWALSLLVCWKAGGVVV